MDKKDEQYENLSDEELVGEIAALARLDIEPGEIREYAAQMRSILDYFEDLKEIDLTGVSPTVQINHLKIPLKPDEVEPGLPRNTVLNLSMRRDGDFISDTAYCKS